jgi:3-oxoacyl-(acyl-carrier-protein) reductase
MALFRKYNSLGVFMLLKGKTALVTGSGRGIGKSIAMEFAKEGADIILNDIDEDSLKGVSTEIKKLENKCFYIAADVGSEKDVNNMFDYILKQAGTLDILVNNAGILIDKTLHKMNSETWNRVINVNLNSIYNCCKNAVMIMREKKYGRIINMASVSALTGNFGQTNYAASKAGVVGFTKSLALETAKKGITVNAIAPGFIDTEMIATIPDDIKETFLSRIPAGRFGLPEEVAKLAVFLASDNASYITGQVLNINGGYLMV